MSSRTVSKLEYEEEAASSTSSRVHFRLQVPNPEDDEQPKAIVPTCKQCSKVFPSKKSLYGHLRTHPERHRRGSHHPVPAMTSQWGMKDKRGRPDQTIFHAAATLISMSNYSAAKLVQKCHKCSTCSKSFPSHQALGGHMASHNKNKGNSVNAVGANGAVEHRCRFCNETFSCGQALGGHMRRHTGPLSSKSETPSCMFLDLNDAPE